MIRIKRRPGIENNPDLLRRVLEVWGKTDSQNHSSKAVSYLTGLSKVDPLGTASREIKWLIRVAQTKQEMQHG